MARATEIQADKVTIAKDRHIGARGALPWRRVLVNDLAWNGMVQLARYVALK